MGVKSLYRFLWNDSCVFPLIHLRLEFNKIFHFQVIPFFFAFKLSDGLLLLGAAEASRAKGLKAQQRVLISCWGGLISLLCLLEASVNYTPFKTQWKMGWKRKLASRSEVVSGWCCPWSTVALAKSVSRHIMRMEWEGNLPPALLYSQRMEAPRDRVAGQPPCWTLWNPFHKITLQQIQIPNWGHLGCWGSQ